MNKPYGTRRLDWSDLEPLYDRIRRCRPGSEEERVAERTLEYAIEALASAREFPAEHAATNLRRNARHNEFRASAADRRRHLRLVTAAGPRGLGVGWTPSEDLPLSSVIAFESFTELHAQLQGPAGRVLDTMMLDLPVEDTASELFLSERTVKRLREQVRSSARQLLATA